MHEQLRQFIDDEGGATAVEYALIVFAIAGLITFVAVSLGTKVKGLWNEAESKMPTSGSP